MNLGRHADGGAGLVWNDRFVGPLRRLAAVVKDNGAVAGTQLSRTPRASRARAVRWTAAACIRATRTSPSGCTRAYP